MYLFRVSKKSRFNSLMAEFILTFHQQYVLACDAFEAFEVSLGKKQRDYEKLQSYMTKAVYMTVGFFFFFFFTISI
jgi:hypothetical protein